MLQGDHDAGDPAGDRQGRRDGVVDAFGGGWIDAELAKVPTEPVRIRATPLDGRGRVDVGEVFPVDGVGEAVPGGV
ncbi:hypothetical protein BKM31_16775 [[Actinomadura] parvosata subsp. kistnae]|uniref:Uncharacterized protein n=1 Tax=[Actinomadura] parvosata subsp. kistnae TaxID=1909395 RepID=A0A1U9ZY63_9ACTN|nr:hypothetical protein [Nonomuraea sp. ATCC 55076]AQZ62892.1 hypothetical protein BKM31_16775 [Nonomuraea sp. ATCC 55076]